MFTKDELLRDVWGFRSRGVSRTLDSHAVKLRNKLRAAGETQWVENVWGVGYRLAPVGPGEGDTERGMTATAGRDRSGRQPPHSSRRSSAAPASSATKRRGLTPTHLTPVSAGGCDHPDCVVPMCWTHRRAYEAGRLDVLPHLEPRWRREIAHAVSHLGLISVYRRLTGGRLPSADLWLKSRPRRPSGRTNAREPLATSAS